MAVATGAVVTGRLVRLLLLLCTLVGLTAMHTLGHVAHASADHATRHGTAQHPAPVEPAAPSTLAEPATAPALTGAAAHSALAAMAVLPAVAGMAVRPVLAGAASGCPGDARQVRALPLGDLGGDPSGWSVCLAVLGALAAALLVAVLLRAGSRLAGPTVGGPFRVAAGSRAPPTRPYGLRLATASVLRR